MQPAITPAVMQGVQALRAAGASAGVSHGGRRAPIIVTVLQVMRALGDRRLHYLGALSWPMIARQPCHVAPADPSPSKREKWLWETSTRQIYASLKLAPR